MTVLTPEAAGLDTTALAAVLDADRVLDCEVEPVDYPLDTITTAARWWVRGRVERGGAAEPYRLVAKMLRGADRSPIWPLVPPPLQPLVLESLDWRVEPAVYRSTLAAALPEGLRLPRCHAVVALDDASAVLWLEAVEHQQRPWTEEDLAQVARLLGRFAGSPAVVAVAEAVGHPHGIDQARTYWQARLRPQYLPAYRSAELWRHPVIAAQVDPRLRGRILALLDAVPALLDEIEALPLLAAHGDACPNNVLLTADGVVAIDWGFFGRGRLAFDLSQLVVSEIELGRLPGAALPHRQDVALAGYREGLADAGVALPESELRRAHQVQLAVAAGVSAIPLEQLGGDPEALAGLLHERLVALDHILAPLGL